jgi:hypothetical protein
MDATGGPRPLYRRHAQGRLGGLSMGWQPELDGLRELFVFGLRLAMSEGT